MVEATSMLEQRLPQGIRLAAVASILYLFAYLLAPGGWLQLPITFGFLLVCPGVLLLDWIDLSDRVVATTMIVSSSLAVNILLSTLLAGTSIYNASSGLVSTLTTTVALGIISFAFLKSRSGAGTGMAGVR